MPELSVIIPTYNRSAMLLKCLDALHDQTIARARYEILVIDDCSPDDTPRRMSQRPSVRFFRQARNAGPSAARNVGIREAQGDWLLFLDDDILVAPNTLEQHLAAHAEQPGENVAVLGVTRVAPGTPVTPLMHYLLTSGKSPLIDSSGIPDPNNVPFGYFQTNASVARTFLLEHGLFDEDLRFAYGEDTELAYRLHRVGMRIVFRPEIVVDHYGILSYQYARRRAHTAGKVAILTHRKHPEWQDIRFLRYGPKSRLAIMGKRFLAEQILDPLLLTADARQWDHPALGRACGFCLQVHQLGGMLDTARAERMIT
ncbi:MAG: glycosyltransferase [Anaerolineae bacterium]|nr:glycosyltransferase [Anaerolineae bacterium]